MVSSSRAALERRRLVGIRKARSVRRDVQRFDSARPMLTEVSARPVRMYGEGSVERADLGPGVFEMTAKAGKDHPMFDGLHVALTMRDAHGETYSVEVLWAVPARRGSAGGTRVAARVVSDGGLPIDTLEALAGD